MLNSCLIFYKNLFDLCMFKTLKVLSVISCTIMGTISADFHYGGCLVGTGWSVIREGK